MSQINQYVNEALLLDNDDLFDIDKFLGPAYESQKLKYSTLKAQLLLDGNFENLATDDIIQTDPVRNYGGAGGDLFFNEMLSFVIDLKDNTEGVRIQRNNATPPVRNTLLFSIEHDTDEHTRFFEDGSSNFEKGTFFKGDGTIEPHAVAGDQANPGILALFASTTRPAVFTNEFFNELPPAFIEQDSAIAWFRSSSKGVLFPNMTEASRDAIPTPELGLVIFNTDTVKLQVYSGFGVSGWQNMN